MIGIVLAEATTTFNQPTLQKPALMFQKISNDRDFSKIKKGDWIVKYPLTGRASDEIDLSDERFFMLYEVYKIDHESELIHLKNLDGPVPDEDQKDSNGVTTDSNGETTEHGDLVLVEKHKKELIADSVWWHR